MITCEEFTDQVSDYLDNRIPFGERIGVCMHRLMCVRCRNFYRQLKEIVEFVEDYGEAAEKKPSSDQQQELLTQFRERYGA